MRAIALTLVATATAVVLFGPNSAFAAVTFDPDGEIPAEETLQSREKEFQGEKLQAIPTNDLLVFDEKRQIDLEISAVKQIVSEAKGRKATIPLNLKFVVSFEEMYAEAKTIECKEEDKAKRAALAKKWKSSQSIPRSFGSRIFSAPEQVLNLRFTFSDLDSYVSMSDDKFTSQCPQLKEELFGEGVVTSTAELITGAKQQLADMDVKLDKSLTSAESLLRTLEKRKGVLESKLLSVEPQQKISENISYVMAIICVFSVVTFFLVRIFSIEVQMELVGSGQVIQFITVMILLSVVLALGLAGILRENTLGTLLGGLAGYVLAQGVGRAAARDAERRLTAAGRGSTPP